MVVNFMFFAKLHDGLLRDYSYAFDVAMRLFMESLRNAVPYDSHEMVLNVCSFHSSLSNS
jgi:hypothetical protein